MKSITHKLKYTVILAQALMVSEAHSLTLPEAPNGNLDPSFTYQGRFADSAGKAMSGEIDLRFQIFSADGKCLLYEESQKATLAEQSKGVVSLKVGSFPANTKRTASDPQYVMTDIFSNKTLFPAKTDCVDGYKPKSGDARWLRVFVKNDEKEVLLSPDQIISSVPTALVAETLQGLTIGDLDKRYVVKSKILDLVKDKFCYSDGENIHCDRDISTLRGPKGDKGDTGAQGPQGVAGKDGLKGDKGDTGAQGPQGLPGVAGKNGTNGINGKDGAAGKDGLKGDKGDTGAQGPQGVAGKDGLKGDKGDTGAQGPQGLPGIAGKNGTNGINGKDGAQGPQGLRGLTGLNGVNGEQGPKGATGATGPQGPQGPKGADGKGLTALGLECPVGTVMKGINANGTLKCAPAISKEMVRVVTSSGGSRAQAYCNINEVRLSCTGSRNLNLSDTCDEDSCGIVGFRPIVHTDGRQGCETSIDTGGGTQAVAIAICLKAQ